MRIAVIGAGLAGLVCAQALQRHSLATVRVFEKARGPGGRLSTRYDGPWEWDHGAPFFAARHPAFRAFVDEWMAQGVISRWDARFTTIGPKGIEPVRQWGAQRPHYVGTPRMNGIAHALASDLDVVLHTRITRLERVRASRPQWRLYGDDEHDLGVWDWVISTAPLPQTYALIPSEVGFRQALEKLHPMQGCYAVMLGVADQPMPPRGWDAALCQTGPISWISHNASKPHRPLGKNTWVILSRNQWAMDHADQPLEWVQKTLCAAAAAWIPEELAAAERITTHAWRYANVARQNAPLFFWDPHTHIAACGDWCIQGIAESAYRSAKALVEALFPLVPCYNVATALQ